MISQTGEKERVSEDSTLTIGQVAWLKVVDVNDLGAFVDWGLSKDLFIPFAEQQHPLRPGSFTLVKIYLDNQGRPAGSTRIDHWIEDTATSLSIGQEVALLIAEQTDLGFKAIINDQFWGLLYSNELHRRVRKGQVVEGYIQRIRDDGKIDLTLNQPGFSASKIDAVARAIEDNLHANSGFLALNDKSPPPDIYAAFGVSKKVFKQAVGALYKARKITIEPGGLRSTSSSQDSADAT
jgi:predicted RNA-binding protein (virulence factor B family)